MSGCEVCGAALLTTASGPLCGACALGAGLTDPRNLIGEYELGHLLGEGAMGIVYLAKHVTSDEVVAIKVAKPELLARSGGAALFRQQAKLESALKHPSIVHVQGAGVHDDRPFLVMPLLEGGTLAEPHNSARFETAAARLALVLEIARALSFAHEHGVLHCDLKPENILFDAELRPHVSDFGMALSLDSSGATSAASGGTRGWMSPEQVRGEPLTAASDVFALGVLLHWLASGRPPFGDGDEFEQRVLHDPPSPLRSWSPELAWSLEAVAHKALRRAPEERYPSAEALVRDLARLATGRTLEGTTVPVVARAWYWSERHPGARNAIFALLPCFAFVISLMANAQRAALREAVLEMNAHVATDQAAAALFQLRDLADTIERAAADPAVRALSTGPRRAAIDEPKPTKDPCSVQEALEDASPLSPYASKFATMAVLDTDGCPRARVASDAGSTEYIRTSQKWRSYFSMASLDAARSARTTQVRMAYRSNLSHRLKFAISTQLFDGEQWVGVVTGSITAAATLGAVRTAPSHAKDQLTALLGPFEGEQPELGVSEAQYAFLVHPRLASGQKVSLDRETSLQLSRAFRGAQDKRPFELAGTEPIRRAEYVDALLGGSWLAAFAPVGGTEYVVAVQTRDAVAVAPSNGLSWLGFGTALGSGSSLALWAGFSLWRRRRERRR